MKIWEIEQEKPNFPNKTVCGLGVALLLHGVCLLSLGIFDVIWTVFKYTSSHNCPDTWPQGLETSCDHERLVWTWVAGGIWAGCFVLFVGVFGVVHSREDRWHYSQQLFTTGCVLLIFPVCPAVITCGVLEIYYGKGVFYTINKSDLDTEDSAKFVVPLLVVSGAIFAWILAIIGVALVYVNRTHRRQKLVYQKPSRSTVILQLPQLVFQPPTLQQPGIQYSVLQGLSVPNSVLEESSVPYTTEHEQGEQLYELVEIPPHPPQQYYVYTPPMMPRTVYPPMTANQPVFLDPRISMEMPMGQPLGQPLPMGHSLGQPLPMGHPLGQPHPMGHPLGQRLPMGQSLGQPIPMGHPVGPRRDYIFYGGRGPPFRRPMSYRRGVGIRMQPPPQESYM